MKRYVVQVEKYVWAEDDKDVISKMEHECSKEDIKKSIRKILCGKKFLTVRIGNSNLNT